MYIRERRLQIVAWVQMLCERLLATAVLAQWSVAAKLN